MASSINADNGVVSGSSGLKSTADTSGVLALQTNGTTALTINTDLSATFAGAVTASSFSGTTTTATNLAGGSNGTIPYQSASGTTQMLAAGTSGQVLTSSGAGAPTWTTPSSGAIGTDMSYVDYLLTTSTAICSVVGAGIYLQSVSLDGTSELMVIQSNASAHAVVFNTSTNTFGTPVLVRTADLSQIQYVALAKISSTSVLICSLPNASTSLETVVLTISGSTVTVGTPLATTLAAASNLITANTRLVTVGSSYVLNYFTTSNSLPKFRAITVSGTTPSIGSELAYAGGTSTANHHSYAYSSSILLHFSSTATTVYAYPISVSGTTLTGGTQATATTTAVNICTGALSNSRYALAYINTTGRGAVVSVGGTTASISTAATTMSIGSWAPMMQVFANQAIILTGSNASNVVNVLTDTAGTASLGIEIPTTVTCNMVGYLSTGKVFIANGNAGTSDYYQYGISAGSPVLEKSFPNVTNTTTPVNATTFNSARYLRPLSGPPQSGSGQPISVRTASGKTAPATTFSNPFTISIDGTYPSKLQQGANPFDATFNDAISDAVCWAIPTSQSATTTTVQLRKVTLV